MKLYICTTIQQEKAQGGGAKIRTAIFFISCCNIAPHLWLSFLKTILVIVIKRRRKNDGRSFMLVGAD